ncbi:MAG: TonB family protein [Gammaproteobacteria bacterium]|jgi:TonB family protein
MSTTFYRVYELPWSLSAAEEQRFRKILLHVCGALLTLAVLMPWLPTPEIERDKFEEIPERYAQLLLERKELPPPPVVVPEKAPEPEPEQIVDQAEPEPEIHEPEPVEQPKVAEVDAREKAAARLSPFMEELAELRDNQAVSAVKSQQSLEAGIGDGPRNERSLITSSVGKASGGINTAALSRNTGGGGLQGREVTKVASAIETQVPRNEARRRGDSNLAARSREEIELVFDRNKGAIYSLYTRALRKNPGLQGKLVLKFTIEPSGAISMCEVVSSELEDPDLERKLVNRIKMFRFEAREVETITTTKPIDFFPA